MGKRLIAELSINVGGTAILVFGVYTMVQQILSNI